jgi:transposase
VDTYHRGNSRRKESMLAKQRQFTEEFRLDAIRLARSSPRSMRQTATDLGIPQATLSRWLREARQAGAVAETLSADERTELAELRRRVRVLETEREILRKAAAFFAQESERTR